MMLKIDETRKKVENAINKFLQCDSVLLEIDVNERTMTHKLAEYLQQEFHEWNVDCEYNRKINSLKTLSKPSGVSKGFDFWQDTDAKTVYPDIIVHKRRSNENLLVIEAKKSLNGDNGDWDKAKLRAFKREPYKYGRAFFVRFHVKKGRVDFEEFLA